MKKILCYMLSSVFLLAILSACEKEEEAPEAPPESPPAPPFTDLEGIYTGDSNLELNLLLPTPLSITSDTPPDGTELEFFRDEDFSPENLLSIFLTTQLSIRGGTPVIGIFSFGVTIDNLARENNAADGAITFDVGDVSTADYPEDAAIILGNLFDGTIISLNLRDVQATKATEKEIVLSAKATIPQADATAFIAAVDPSAPAATADVDVEIAFSVDNLTKQAPRPLPPSPPPTLADLEGTYIGDSDLDLNFLLPTPVAVTSDKATDGAAVVIEYYPTENLVIAVTDAQLSTASGTAVAVDGVFTFSIGNLSESNEDGLIHFDVDDTGSVDITVGSGMAITLSLTSVTATEATEIEVTLSANATLTQVQANEILGDFSIGGSVPPRGIDVEISLSVDNITYSSPPPPPPTLADLEGTYTGDSDLDLNFLLTPPVPVSSDELTDGAFVVFKDVATENLVITLTSAQLSIAGQTAVDVGGVFTFTIDNLAWENDVIYDEIVFDIGDTGSVDLTVGSVSSITLSLTSVATTEATESGITLSGTANLTEAQANEILGDFGAGVSAPSGGVDVEISLAVENITP